MTDRLELLSDIAFELSHARETGEMRDILAANGIEDAKEITACLAAAVIVNGKRLDEVIKLFDSTNESIKGSILTQEDETLLN